MASLDVEALTDLVYESAVVPELWPKVLDRLAHVAQCDGGALFTIDAAQSVKFVTAGIHVEGMPKLVNEGWMERNTRVFRAAAKKHAGFLTDHDLFTAEEIEHEPIYEFLRANKAGWGVGTVIPTPTNDTITFTFDRAHVRGPVNREAVSQLDALRPHLARAGLISCRLRLEQARSMVNALDLIGLPAAVLSSDGRMLAANDRLLALNKQFAFRAFDYLSLTNRSAAQLLADALSQVKASSVNRMRSIAVPAIEDHDAAIAHVIPIKGTAADVFMFDSNLLVTTPLVAPNAPPEDILNGLFDLTPAEARVAQGIVRGHTLAEIAQAFSVTPHTVRTQLKAVLEKTGTHRQAELVGLLGGWMLRDGLS